MSYAVYVYADAHKVQQKVEANQLNWAGTFAMSGTYHAASFDALAYGSSKYIAISDTYGVTPLTVLPNRQPNPFSALIVVKPGDEPPFQPSIAGVGTIPYSSAVNGTIVYDFNGSAAQETTVNGPLWLSATPVDELRTMVVVLKPDGASHVLGYDAFKWFGSNPPGTISTHEVMLTLRSFGTNPSSIRAIADTQV